MVCVKWFLQLNFILFGRKLIFVSLNTCLLMVRTVKSFLMMSSVLNDVCHFDQVISGTMGSL